MARVKRRVETADVVTRDHGPRRGPTFTVPGLYQLLRQHDRDNPECDPRWSRNHRDQPCPDAFLQQSYRVRVADLDAGRPVQLPAWCKLAGVAGFAKAIPGLNDQRSQLESADRAIVGWLVYSDDVLAPMRKGGR